MRQCPGRVARLQLGAFQRSAIDGRLPDHVQTRGLHRRIARPRRPARHLHDQRRRSSAERKAPPIIGSRLVFNGDRRQRHLPDDAEQLRRPGQTSTLFVDSHGPPFAVESLRTKNRSRPPLAPAGCENVPFNPTIAVDTQGGTVDSPEATTVNVGIPFDATEPIANSYLKDGESRAAGRDEHQPVLGQRPRAPAPTLSSTRAPTTRSPVPPRRKSAPSRCRRPSLPADSLTGTVYVAQPAKNGPGAASTGEQFRIFIHAGSERYGVNVRLIGKITPNLATGQLTAVVPTTRRLRSAPSSSASTVAPKGR